VKLKKVKATIKERWKFYLIGYLIGYAIPLITYGAPNWRYLFPIKIIGIACALGIGNAFYYGSKQIPVFEITKRSIKYVLIIVAMILITFGFKELILSIYGFDITPFLGFPEPTR
jgi:uncharacterized membrane protein YkvI